MDTSTTLKVLVVEDNPGDYLLVEEYLQSADNNYSIVHAETMGVAEKFLAAEKYDVILLDLSLPDSTGVNSVRVIVESNNHTPVIVLTGFGNRQYGIDSLKTGAADYLVKDEINSSVLEKSISYCIERNKLQKEMNKMDRLFRVITENSRDAKMILNAKGVILFCTSSVYTILGFTRQECIGKNKKDLLHPDYVNLFLENIAAVNSNPQHQPTFEVKVKHKMGGYLWNEISMINLFDDPNVNGIVCSERDITEKKQAEQKMASSEKRFRALVQQGSDLIGILDEEGYYLYVTETVTSVLGFHAEELIGKTAFSFIHPDDVQYTLEQFKMLKPAGQLQLNPFRFKNSAGQWRWIDTIITDLLQEPSVNGIVANSRDITEKIIADKELEKLSLIAKETNNAVVITDSRGFMTWVNDSFTVITGYTIEEAIGKKPGDLLQGKDTDPNTVNMMRKRLAAGKGFVTDILNYGKDGRKYWLRIECQPILDEHGNTDKFFAIETDITDRKESRELLVASEVRYRNLFDVTPASVIIWDPISLKILEVNNTATNVYGYNTAEFMQMTIVDVQDPDEKNTINEVLPGKDKDKVPVHKVLQRHRTKIGELIFMEFHSHFISINGREAVLALGENVTQKLLLENLLEEERVQNNNQIAEAVITAQEREREEIGRELHDNVNQILAGSRLYLGLVKNEAGGHHPYIDETDKLLKNAINELRGISHALMPPSLQEEDFMDALDDIIRVTEKGTSIKIEKQTKGFNGKKIPDKMWLAIYRIIQEQFQNILKYANADNVILQLGNVENTVILNIKDDGVGFDTTQKSHGIGLMNIKTRASIFNGSVTINSVPGSGCELSVLFNLKD